MALNEQMREAIQEDIVDTRSKKERIDEQMGALKTAGKTVVENVPGVGEAILAKDIAGDVSEGNYASAALGAAALGVGFLPAGDILNKPIKAAAKKLRKQDAEAANKMLKDVDSIDTWKKQNPNPKPQKQNPDIEKAANDLLEGNITGKQYRSVVKENMPIVKIQEVPEIPSFTEIVGALNKDKSAKGILGLNKTVKDGTRVASRLDIPAYEKFDKWVVSVHDAYKKGRESLDGDIMGYGKTAILKNVEFKGMSQGAARISSRREDKGTIARIFGDYYNAEPENVAEYAAQAMKDKNWTQVGYNPFRHGFFYDKDTGMPIKSAEEVIQVGPLVLAKNAQKMKISEAKQVSPKGGIKIRTGKPIEGLQNLKETKTVFNEGGAVMNKQMELFEPVERGFDEGGLMDEGGSVDPVSGNDVPVGSTQEEVRDDIPAQLSEGEFVLPADVVRYHGLEKIMALRDEAKAGLARMEAMGQMGNSDEATIPDGVPFTVDDLDMEDDGVLEYAEGGVVEAQVGAYIPPQAPTGVQFTGGGTQQSQFTPQTITPPPPVPTMQPFNYQAPVQQQTPTYTPTGTPTFGDVMSGGQGSATGAAEVITIVNSTTGEKRQINFIPGVTQIPEGFVRESEYTPREEVKIETTSVAPTTGRQIDNDGDDPSVPEFSTSDVSGIGYDRGKIKNKDLLSALNKSAGAMAKGVASKVSLGAALGQKAGLIGGVKAENSILGGVIDEFRGLQGSFDTGRLDGSYTNTTALHELTDLQQQTIADVFNDVSASMNDLFTKTNEKGETVAKTDTEITESLRARADRLGISTTFEQKTRQGTTIVNKRNDTLTRQIALAEAANARKQRTETAMASGAEKREAAESAAAAYGVSTEGKSVEQIQNEIQAEQKARADAARERLEKARSTESYRQAQDDGFGGTGYSSGTSFGGTGYETSTGEAMVAEGGLMDKNKLSNQMKRSGLASKK